MKMYENKKYTLLPKFNNVKKKLKIKIKIKKIKKF